jgi:hypothetical protein
LKNNGPTLKESRLTYRDCPWCPGEYGVGLADEGEPVVAHTLPACIKYVALHADEFLDAVRLAGRPS